MIDTKPIDKTDNQINTQPLEVLIVDRDKEASLLKLQIQKMKHNATILENYKEAYEEINKDSFDLIIVDINLHYGNGIDFIKQIRKSQGLLNVIAMTHNSSRELEKKAREERVIYYIIKPFEAAELQSILGHILKKKIINQAN